MYPSLLDDVKWLRFSTEVKAKLTTRVSGTTDVFVIGDGRLLFVVNTTVLDEVFGFYTPLHRAAELGVDGLVDHFAKRVMDSRNRE